MITQHHRQCHVPCKYPIKIKGHCCPSCTVCPYPDADERDEIELDKDADPCLRCYCVKGQMLCHRKTCPVLPCSPANQVKPPKTCCPVCRKSERKLVSAGDDRALCRTEASTYHEGETVTLDKCTECVCTNATLICTKRTCQRECSRTPDECCPQCSTTTTVHHRKKPALDCRYNDKYYKVCPIES